MIRARKQTLVQSIAQVFKLSRTTIQKQVTSTDSSKFHESESEEDEIRRHNPNNKSSISLNDPFIAIPKVKLTSS